MKFALVFLIMLVAFIIVLLFVRGVVATFVSGRQKWTNVIADDPKARPILKKYALYVLLFVCVYLAGSIVILFQYFKSQEHFRFPVIGIVLMVIGDAGMHWAKRLRDRKLDRIDIGNRC